jgi:hypothetical protein
MFATAKRSLLLASLLGAAGLYLPASSLAATATVTGTLTGSKLTVSTTAAPTFTANLDNGDSTPTYGLPLTVQDTRGTGAGWNLTVTSTQFSTGGATPSTLATNSSSMSAVAVTPGAGTNTNPTNTITYPVGVPAGSPLPAAVKFFNAAATTGMGLFTVTPTVGVFVPQNSIAGTYTSNVTVAIVSGP